jgi:hypothetical protein
MKYNATGTVTHVSNKDSICSIKVTINEDNSFIFVPNVRLKGDILLKAGDEVKLCVGVENEDYLFSPTEDYLLSLVDEEVARERNPFRTGTILEINQRQGNIVVYDHVLKEKTTIKEADLNMDLRDVLIRDQVSYFGDFDDNGDLFGYECRTDEQTKMAA